MANPTTNYGWPMPTSADLVTDLPADFALFGQPVDTSLKALNPETTLGDIAYRSATSNTNTRLGIGTNGQVLAVSGGVPAWTTTADVTPLTTKGDVFTFSTVDARIGVGANNTVLTADSAEATGLKWATPASGDMTLVTSAAFSSVTSVSLPNSTFTTANNVYVIYFILTGGTGAQIIRIRRRTGGSDTTAASYHSNGFKAQAGATSYVNAPSESSWKTFMTTDSPSYQNGNQITIYQPMTQDNGHMSMNGITDNYAAAIVSGGYSAAGATFDALTWFIPSGTMSGRYSVFKMTN